MKKMRGNGIVKVSDLFAKYIQTLKAPQKTVITTFISVVSELFDLSISPEQCSYSVSSKILTLHVSGMIKTEIKLNKKHIQNRMVEILGEKNVPKDIL
jgi:hypothetical protein